MRKAEPEVETSHLKGEHHFPSGLEIFEKAKAEGAASCRPETDLYRFINGGIDDKLKEIHDNKVEVVVLTQVDELAVEAVKNYMEFAKCSCTCSAPPTIGMVLVDETEAF